MKKTLFILFALLILKANAQTPIPKAISGKIERLENFQSKFVTPRNIDIWLPDGYSDKEKYAVLYMHDGQMLYDSTTTWNKQAWDVDDVASQLMLSKKTKKFIVVGVWNGGETRHKDYFPQKPYESLSQSQKDFVVAELQKMGRTKEVFQPVSDNYLKFLVTELKPYIDSYFSVKTDKNNTFIAGSSMGGLISMYAICEYPQVFGGAACLSTHWTGIFSIENNPIPQAFYQYLEKNLPSPTSHKIYFDYGNQTLDALYPPLQAEVDKIMQQKGFSSKNWMTKFFAGENHSEQAWKKRLHIPLEFLLRK